MATSYYDSYGVRPNSPPLELNWGGWKAHSADLAQQGWEFMIQERADLYGAVQVAFTHRGIRAQGITQPIDRDDLIQASRYNMPLSCVVNLGERVTIQQATALKPTDFISADMSYGFNTDSRVEWELESIFTTTESGIYIPEDTVPDLLQRIEALQEPARQERLKEQVKNERAVTVPTKIVQLRVA